MRLCCPLACLLMTGLVIGCDEDQTADLQGLWGVDVERTLQEMDGQPEFAEMDDQARQLHIDKYMAGLKIELTDAELAVISNGGRQAQPYEVKASTPTSQTLVVREGDRADEWVFTLVDGEHMNMAAPNDTRFKVCMWRRLD